MMTWVRPTTSSTSKGVTAWRRMWPTLGPSQSKPSILSSTILVYTANVYTRNNRRRFEPRLKMRLCGACRRRRQFEPIDARARRTAHDAHRVASRTQVEWDCQLFGGPCSERPILGRMQREVAQVGLFHQNGEAAR